MLFIAPLNFTHTCAFTHPLAIQTICAAGGNLVENLFNKEFLLGDKSTM